MIVMMYMILEIYNGISTIKDLDSFVNSNIKEEVVPESNGANGNYITFISLEKVRKIYDLLGISNISKLSINGNIANIDGVCEDLNILENIKREESIKNLSINHIKKQESNYLFNLTYELGD
ncbi:hypothetical protein [Romboutsia weinsteinii]|nr:hypothetical protein [Romboutsia weinsteinii]